MIEPDLTTLKEIPPPRDAAKRAALAAAMAAFDEAEKKSESETKGTDAPVRLRDASSRTEGKKTMRVFQFNYALAASIAALMIAAPAAFMLSRWGVNFQNVSGGLTTESGSAHTTQGSTKHAASSPTPALSAREEAKRETPVAGVAGGRVDTFVAAVNNQPAPARKAKTDRLSKLDEAPHSNVGATLGMNAVSPAAPAPSITLPAPTSAMPKSSGAARFDGRSRLQAADKKAALERGFIAGAAPDQMNVVPSLAMPQEYFDAAEKEFRDRFDAKDINPVKQVAQEPVSTFSIDVDTASYAFARRMINAGKLPPKDSVRVEEMINYFPYNYPKPESAETPFKPTITVTPSPWNGGNRLVHVAVQGYELRSAQRPRANLVFLVDVSGSMTPDDRLPLVKNALSMLVDELKPEDTVALVTYASGSGVALEPTPISDKNKILAAIDSLGAGGSTAGAQGIQDAYRLAEAHFDKNGVNRVILATDGDFNVGVTDQGALKGLIERKREKGIFLSILGVGQGNYNDSLMQTLAQNGNGQAAYVDTLNEARKALVEEASSTLFPIAKDVKIQIEWNPARVAEYRLIGYETRALRREDFNNDRVDAGDVGSSHRVTAIYEITPAGSDKRLVDDLRYGKLKAPEPSMTSDGELGFFKLRYKLPKEEKSKFISQPIGESQAVESVAKAAEDVRFSIAVAAFGQLLKGAPYLTNYSYDDVAELAQGARGDDHFGYRTEFVNLARLAKSAR